MSTNDDSPAREPSELESQSDAPLEELEESLADGVGDSTTIRRARRVVDGLRALAGQTPVDNGDRHEELKVPGKWGELEVLEKVGRGSYGTVYRAHDPRLDRVVALKLLHQQRVLHRERFLKEGTQLASIRHPNVVTVHGAAEHDGRLGIWTEFLEGRTLEELIRTQGPLGAEEAAIIGRDLCRALTAVHAKGLVHQDVKTTNALREEGGRIVLTDFGCASSVDHDPDGDWGVEGTPLFMAPERLQDAPPAPEQDIYSLGVLLHRLVTGRYPVLAPPIEEPTVESLRDARPDLSREFIEVVETAMAVTPRDRFPSAGAMERALEQVLRRERSSGSRGRVGRRTILMLISLVALLLFAGWAWWPRPLNGEASFFVVVKDEKTGLVLPQPCRPGDSIREGDRMGLELRFNRDAHVYILNEDTAGAVYVMFPRNSLLTRNPLEGGGRHRLPGNTRRDGEEANEYWELGPGTGAELFLILASEEPLLEIEAELRWLQAQGTEDRELRPSAVRQVRGVLRGIQGTVPGPPVEGPVSHAGARLADLFHGPGWSHEHGIWRYALTLANPRR